MTWVPVQMGQESNSQAVCSSGVASNSTCGIAGPVGANNTEDAAGLDRQIDPVQRRAASVALRQRACLNGGGHPRVLSFVGAPWGAGQDAVAGSPGRATGGSGS